jgi:hypothetical protein
VESAIPRQADLALADAGLVTVTGIPSEVPAGMPEGASGTVAGSEGLVEKPFDFVEQMPDFSDGGQAGMLKFISKHLRYPNHALAQAGGHCHCLFRGERNW